MISDQTNEAARCPLCGEANRCAVLNGQSVADCWCSGGPFPKALLEKLPTDRPRNACICKTCIKRFLSDQKACTK